MNIEADDKYLSVHLYGVVGIVFSTPSVLMPIPIRTIIEVGTIP